MAKQTRTITLDEEHNKLAKIIEALRNLGSRSGVISYLLEKEVESNPKMYGNLLKSK
jgi:hypothetical protein